MAFATFSDFLAMGGHGFYVWTSYGVMLGGMLTLVLASRRAQRRWLAGQRQLLRRQRHQPRHQE